MDPSCLRELSDLPEALSRAEVAHLRDCDLLGALADVLVRESQWAKMFFGEGQAALSFSHLNKDDEGLYTLRIVSRGGISEHSAFLFVRGTGLWAGPGYGGPRVLLAAVPPFLGGTSSASWPQVPESRKTPRERIGSGLCWSLAVGSPA